MKDSKIEWTHHTFNPVWGCEKVSQGCKNCYAETLSNRWGFQIWGANSERRIFGEKHWQEPLKWNGEAFESQERRQVFCGSMCDVFEEHPQWISERYKLFQLIEKTQRLDWLLLTKRPENILRMIPNEWKRKPPFNVWYGTSVENMNELWRMDELGKIPAAIRFISAEPLLEEINIKDSVVKNKIDWVIVGGESGHGKRPFNCDWAQKDSPHKSICPACKEGYLLMERHTATMLLSNKDYCILCGQHFVYTDIPDNELISL